MAKKRTKYEVHTELPVNLVVPLLGKGQLKVDDFVCVGLTGNRIQTYRKGCACVRCGLEGNVFRVERQHGHGQRWHLNLYHVDKRGGATLMTSDHIVPKSKGGSGSVRNRQPMCCHCNGKKANKLPKHYKWLKLRTKVLDAFDRLLNKARPARKLTLNI